MPDTDLPFVATINTPGYLPFSDPIGFPSASDAWEFLRDEYVMAWNDLDTPELVDGALPPALKRVYDESCARFEFWIKIDQPGHITVPSPGHEATNPTDLGTCYAVTIEGA